MRPTSGVFAPHRKNTAAMAAETMPPPDSVRVPMSMHIGAPAVPLVKAGDTVKVGQLIGQAGGPISAHVFASVSGAVKQIQDIDPVSGERGAIIVIASDGNMTKAEDIAPPDVHDLESFLAAVRNSGVVGLGGAGFPTAAKLSVKDLKQIEYIIINGAECEPYITSDTRTFIDDRDLVVSGVKQLLKYLEVPKVIIAIEKNKPEAIKIMRRAFEGESAVEIAALKSIYPQGGEKMLIHNLTGRDVPEGKLPLDTGVIVLNVTTLAALARYIETGMPLTVKRVTVDGSAVKNPKNVIVPIGTPVSDVLKYCGADTENIGKILLGGPMMGAAIPDGSLPVKKTTNAILAFTHEDAAAPAETPCIRCGRCVTHCPMGLVTVEIQNAYLAGKPAEIEKLHAGLCIECGCCTYSCPAKRQLTQYMKLAKAELRTYLAAQKELAEREAKRKAAAEGKSGNSNAE